jgi:hypothetical protein
MFGLTIRLKDQSFLGLFNASGLPFPINLLFSVANSFQTSRLGTTKSKPIVVEKFGAVQKLNHTYVLYKYR